MPFYTYAPSFTSSTHLLSSSPCASTKRSVALSLRLRTLSRWKQYHRFASYSLRLFTSPPFFSSLLLLSLRSFLSPLSVFLFTPSHLSSPPPPSSSHFYLPRYMTASEYRLVNYTSLSVDSKPVPVAANGDADFEKSWQAVRPCDPQIKLMVQYTGWGDFTCLIVLQDPELCLIPSVLKHRGILWRC